MLAAPELEALVAVQRQSVRRRGGQQHDIPSSIVSILQILSIFSLISLLPLGEVGVLADLRSSDTVDRQGHDA